MLLGHAPERGAEDAEDETAVPAGVPARGGADAASRDAIAEALAPFLAGDPGAAGPVVDDLVGRGWVAADPNDELALTEAGTRARAALLERVAGTRRLLVQGISDEEYLATVDVLRRKAENLERAAR